MDEKPFGSILVIEDLIGIINKLDVCGCVCMGQDDLEEKFVWKSFSFCSFWCDAWGWRKKYRPIWDEAIERPRSPSGHTTLIRKQPTGTTKKRKGRSPQPGRDVGVINFPN